MSQGLTAYDFVQQVYYAQEKTIIDFWPGDDKYKEVLFEANLILQELQNTEDWTWLRVPYILGTCENVDGYPHEFVFPNWAYKISTLYNDCLYLYHEMPPIDVVNRDGLDWWPWWIRHSRKVPITSTGNVMRVRDMQMPWFGAVHTPDASLRAVKTEKGITFNRLLTPIEEHCTAFTFLQRRIELFHICDSNCTMTTIDGREICDSELDDEGEEIKHLTEIPDPNYLVMATAARHAEGSPPALARVAGLQDAAQRILSAMRQNDASATDSDYQEWDIPGYINVL